MTNKAIGWNFCFGRYSLNYPQKDRHRRIIQDFGISVFPPPPWGDCGSSWGIDQTRKKYQSLLLLTWWLINHIWVNLVQCEIWNVVLDWLPLSFKPRKVKLQDNGLRGESSEAYFSDERAGLGGERQADRGGNRRQRRPAVERFRLAANRSRKGQQWGDQASFKQRLGGSGKSSSSTSTSWLDPNLGPWRESRLPWKEDGGGGEEQVQVCSGLRQQSW